MRSFVTLLICSAFSLSMVSAGKVLEIKATVNLEKEFKMVVTHHTDEGTHYHDGKVVSAKKQGDRFTHVFKVELPEGLPKAERDALVITIFENDTANPMGYGLRLCSLPLKEIPEQHIKLELTRCTLDVTGHYHPEERHYLSIEGPQGFRNGTVAWPLKSEDGRIRVHFDAIPGKAEITMVDMETLDNIARAKVKEEIPWKKWNGVVAKDKPTLWKEKK